MSSASFSTYSKVIAMRLGVGLSAGPFFGFMGAAAALVFACRSSLAKSQSLAVCLFSSFNCTVTSHRALTPYTVASTSNSHCRCRMLDSFPQLRVVFWMM